MTKLVTSIGEMLHLAYEYRCENLTIGFVPTMGALHEGHLSLIKTARAENQRAVVSIFVNPIQFCQGEDFNEYPRNIDGDVTLCRLARADVVFAPSIGEMYPRGFRTYVDQEGLPNRMCGLHRPGHFRGVMTVVVKLFNIVKPTTAYFGQKDYQQCIIIRRMVQDLSMDVQVSVQPTVRAQDGLALSSRNQMLGPRQRREAVCLYKSLQLAQDLIKAGKSSAVYLMGRMKKEIGKVRGAKIDYIVLVHPETLEPVNEVRGKVVAALAVRIGGVRLIDNMVIG